LARLSAARFVSLRRTWQSREVNDRQLGAALSAGDRAGARYVVATLRQELGVVGTVRVLGQIAWWRARGRPFDRLEPAQDERDCLSRRQCGPPVLLYRALQSRLPQPRALAVVHEAIAVGGLPFLERMIPPLDPARLAAQAGALTQRFFNAEGTVERGADGSVTFDVRRCRFVELLRAVEATELTPAFCAVDSRFFDQRRGVQMTRRLTLAGGDDRCDFRFEPGDG